MKNGNQSFFFGEAKRLPFVKTLLLVVLSLTGHSRIAEGFFITIPLKFKNDRQIVLDKIADELAKQSGEKPASIRKKLGELDPVLRKTAPELGGNRSVSGTLNLSGKVYTLVLGEEVKKNGEF